jgi:TRAP-type C4-dicarboxylate transport system substrate-binding protein
MNKKCAILCLFIVTLLLLPSLGFSQLKLKAVTHFPPVSGQAKLFGEFCKKLEEHAGGKIKVTYFPGGALLDAFRAYEGLLTGAADIGFIGLHFTYGRFPVMETAYLPLGFPSGYVSSLAVNDFYRKFSPPELAGVHVFFCNACAPNVLLTKKPISKLEDIKGLTIRATGMVAKVVEALGATPRPLEISEGYEAALRGLLDGFALPVEATKNWKLADVVKYIINVYDVGNIYAFAVAMNKNVWEKLPPDVKEKFTALSNEYVKKFALMWNEIDCEGLKYSLERGLKVIDLPGAEKARWVAAVRPLESWFVEDRAKKGLSKKEVESYIAYLRERIAYWTDVQIKEGIKSATGPDPMRLK